MNLQMAEGHSKRIEMAGLWMDLLESMDTDQVDLFFDNLDDLREARKERIEKRKSRKKQRKGDD